MRRRGGNVMVVIAVLCMLAFAGISSLDYLTRNDVSTTATLVRELFATNLAESIAAQLEARVARHPWEERFWELENQKKGTPGDAMVFAKADGVLKISGEGLPDGDWDYVVRVKDQDAGMHEYRFYVEVSVQGMRFTYSWDKRSDESLLSGLNRDASRLDKQLDDIPPATDGSEGLLNAIKEKTAVPASDTLRPEYVDLLKKLQSDAAAYQGATLPPAEPTAPPSPPPAPTYDPSAPPPTGGP